jgi:DNA-binding protein H-NS
MPRKLAFCSCAARGQRPEQPAAAAAHQALASGMEARRAETSSAPFTTARLSLTSEWQGRLAALSCTLKRKDPHFQYYCRFIDRRLQLSENSARVSQPSLPFSDAHLNTISRRHTMAPQINFKTMAVNKLIALRSQVDAMLSDKVAEQRRTLTSELAKLDSIAGNPRASKRTGASAPRGKVAPKYRNHDNPSETWAGRGLKPRWLTEALKAGGKIEDFSIGADRPTTRRTKRVTPK